MARTAAVWLACSSRDAVAAPRGPTNPSITKILSEAAVKRPYRVLPGANKILKQLGIKPVRMGGY